MASGHTTLAQQEKQPRTERGRKTLRKLLDAATLEFGVSESR